ncbi:hypothetical protein DPMN_032720 [Dreissena polymorpha]|uniref:Uncharacterized protein n=1 Tax=Dreissena polymorpha TaxID=45954 RepID=A0A9D4RI79_DREPO|nr:hypothetical protein DPMN_032720 [Dreissena polymorpha]
MLYLAGAFTYKTLYEAALDQQLKHDSSDNPDFFHELNTLALNPRSLRHTCRIFINKNLHFCVENGRTCIVLTLDNINSLPEVCI